MEKLQAIFTAEVVDAVYHYQLGSGLPRAVINGQMRAVIRSADLWTVHQIVRRVSSMIGVELTYRETSPGSDEYLVTAP